MSFLTDIEQEREQIVRGYVCPTCHAERSAPCRTKRRPNQYGTVVQQAVEVSHTSRYLKAVAAGRVPALPGGGDA